jgi:hypothetical protein
MRANGAGCEVEIVVNWLERKAWCEIGEYFETSIRYYSPALYGNRERNG